MHHVCLGPLFDMRSPSLKTEFNGIPLFVLSNLRVTLEEQRGCKYFEGEIAGSHCLTRIIPKSAVCIRSEK